MKLKCLARWDDCGERVISLSYRKPFLYVGDDTNRVHILDLTSPKRPEKVVSFRIGDFPNAMAAEGRFMFLAANKLGFMVVDLTDPKAPGIAARVEIKKSEAHDLATTKNYAYLVGPDDRLRIFDISMAREPQEVGSVKLPKQPVRVHVSWPMVYVALAKRQLAIVDASSAREPKVMSVTKVDDDIHGLHVVDHLAFVAMNEAGMKIFDVADPIHPASVSDFVPKEDYATEVVVRNGVAYLLTIRGRLFAVDVSDPRRPKRAASYGAGGPGSCLSLADRVCVIGIFEKYPSHGIEIVDITPEG